jgi:hypothetical protein
MARQQHTRGAQFEVLERLANTPIPAAEEVIAVAADRVIDRPWLADQAEELALEQERLFDAEGLTAARRFDVEAAGHRFPASVARHRVEGLVAAADAAGRYAAQIRKALAPFAFRAPDAKRWYWVRMAALYGGDVGTCTGALVLLGELPIMAFALALSVAAAAVIAGLVGSDIKRVRLARERQMAPESVPAHLLEWSHLFWGVDAGRAQVRVMVKVAATAIVCLLVGVLALRWSLDGPLAGVSFGCFAAAISLGSVWNSYTYTDSCAEMIDAAERDYDKLARKAAKVASSSAIRQRAGAVAGSNSIEVEHAARGQAARAAIMAAKFAGYSRQPHIVGHGPASDARAPIDVAVRSRPVWRQQRVEPAADDPSGGAS